MRHSDPDGARKRRRLAGVVLAAGGVAVILTASKDYPREQPIVFRLPDTKPVTLVASFTRVGEAEAHTGVTLELPERAFRDVNHVLRVPNGDYIVTIDLRGPVTRKETSVSRRVSLSGSEVVVPVPARSE
jgi:hypothetical protein